MKRSSLFILFSVSLLSLTSCDFITIFDYYKTIEVDWNKNISGGSIEVYTNSINPNSLKIGDKIYIRAIPDSGYKCDKILVNGSDIGDNIYFTLNRASYEIDASFSLFSEENRENVSSLNSDITYQDIYASEALGITPSSGNVNILVVPVEFSDYPSFSNSELNNIDLAFNSDDPTYFESVRSYYKKSSYGALDLRFDIADVYHPSFTGTHFKYLETNSESGAEGSLRLLDEIRSNVTLNGQKINNYSIYDSNKDGYVDGVWLIYNAQYSNEVYNDQYFWAYTYSDIENDFNKSNATFSRYANASQIFLKNNHAKSNVDTHTLIHETGHMLGLDDYYSYDENVSYSASGGLDMMDLNIGDHNAFSKFALGWGNPKIVNGSSRINLAPVTTSGNYLILPLSENYNKTAFDEYLIVEYYTPNELYELDSEVNYYGGYPSFYNYNGVRIYHVDARTYDFNDELNTNITNFINNINRNGSVYEDLSLYRYVGASNTASYSYINDGYHHLLEQITPFNRRAYNSFYLGHDTLKNESIQGLFKVGDVFNSSNQSEFFIDGKSHSGKNVNYTIRVEGLSDEHASLTIKVN